MPNAARRSNPAQSAGERARMVDATELRRFLRYSHVFASAIRDILDVRLLREASPHPLSPSQLYVLKLMTLGGRHHVGDVADFLGVSAPAATKNIDKLEGLGLVARSPSEGDRRATLLSVSQEGRRLVRQHEDLNAARLTSVLERFEANDIERFADLLEQLSLSLLELTELDQKHCMRCAAYTDPNCPIGRIQGGCPYDKNRTPPAMNAPPGDSPA